MLIGRYAAGANSLYDRLSSLLQLDQSTNHSTIDLAHLSFPPGGVGFAVPAAYLPINIPAHFYHEITYTTKFEFLL